ncbi:hypothetical protein RB195_013524 [Necator americanus]|uniref:Uncharacterized protein n=1 Tax=Necator americanus TaxID=51031 RepID=A0ABR1DVW4_NECAM
MYIEDYFKEGRCSADGNRFSCLCPIDRWFETAPVPTNPLALQEALENLNGHIWNREPGKFKAISDLSPQAPHHPKKALKRIFSCKFLRKFNLRTHVVWQ